MRAEVSGRWQEEVWARAEASLPPHVFRFFTAGAREETTLGEAVAAWGAYRFRPRVLRDVRDPDPTTTLLGSPVATPIAIAPTSMQRWAHPEGELAMARAALEAETLMVVSSNAGTPFTQIGAVGVTWWLQAYVTQDRDLMAPTLRTAVDAGARAVVLTLDTPFPGPKWDIDTAAFGDLTPVYGVNHPEVVRGDTPGAEHARDLGPDDIAWLRQTTGLPVVVKGVLHADDARRCVEAGAAAVWVSNHGGRQLDRAAPSAHSLPDVVAAVAETAEVYVDGGIRSGVDALAALALGADAVFCGRLPLLALSEGHDGVRRVLAELDRELREAMSLGGCPTLTDTRGLLAPGHPAAEQPRRAG